MKLRQWFSKFMYGRYGADEYGRFLSIAALIPLILSIIIRDKAGAGLFGVTLAILIYQYFRMFSRRTEKRRIENQAYLKIKNRIVTEFRGMKSRFSQRKQYKFFRCKKCRAYLRVPRGKGKVSIRCSRCGNQFSAKA